MPKGTGAYDPLQCQHAAVAHTHHCHHAHFTLTGGKQYGGLPLGRCRRQGIMQVLKWTTGGGPPPSLH